MPAGPLGERRGKPRLRTESVVTRARPRRASAPVPSKLRAARTVGVRAPAAAAAAALLAVLILAAALATGGRGERFLGEAVQMGVGGGRLVNALTGLFKGGFAGVGFRVASVRLEGASPAAENEIRNAAAIPVGAPILDLDLDVIRAQVERVGWVERARVMRLLPDTVLIDVDQRPLAAIWQVGQHRYVVGSGGQIMSGIEPRNFATLPSIIGPDANIGFARLLTEIRRHPRLDERKVWLRRVDGRRWDVLLRDGGVVLLPPSDEGAALDRLDRLDRTAHVLDLGLARIDLRNQHFTVLRTKTPVVVGGAAPTSRGE
jgi:cell division protein FtsQ